MERYYFRGPDTDGNGSLDQRQYALHDANFNVTALTNSSGTLVERFEYDPYGKRSVLNADWSPDGDGQSDVAFVHGHQGLKYDEAAGLYDSRLRPYDPDLGRFTSQDPVGYLDGMSRYQGYGSSPGNFVDPAGLNSGIPDSGFIPLPGLTPPPGGWGDGGITLLPAGVGVAGEAVLIDFDQKEVTDQPDADEPSLADLLDGVFWQDLIEAADHIPLFVIFDGTGQRRTRTVMDQLDRILPTAIYFPGVGSWGQHSNIVSLVLGQLFGHKSRSMVRKAERDIMAIRATRPEDSRPVGIYILGYSRGAAQAVELADNLRKRGVPVHLLVLVDPVYRMGLPTKADLGWAKKIPSNVVEHLTFYSKERRLIYGFLFDNTRLTKEINLHHHNHSTIGRDPTVLRIILEKIAKMLMDASRADTGGG